MVEFAIGFHIHKYCVKALKYFNMLLRMKLFNFSIKKSQTNKFEVQITIILMVTIKT